MNSLPYFSWQAGRLLPHSGKVVNEFPLKLIVNGREIATLIASPHELRHLVAGFLRLQGFISSLADVHLLSVCEDFGTATVRLAGELPERLKPVLTSGCGTGISFAFPAAGETGNLPSDAGPLFRGEQVLAMMEDLFRKAQRYRNHGGMHSAAVGRDGEPLLWAEDLGRHNTLDRIAGEALFRGVDLTGTMLVTSGRVSTEMVAKAHLLGVRLIASRTSPTDMAVRFCDEHRICLAGYVRGEGFTVYSHPEMIDLHPESRRIPGISGVILAGGSSRRMGVNKAMLTVDGVPLIERVHRTMASLFCEVILVTHSPAEYAFLPCVTTSDRYPHAGALAGLHAGLLASSCERVFVCACDMPFLNPELIRMLCGCGKDHDAVVPVGPEGFLEPLHGVYDRSILAAAETALEQGDLSILSLLEQISTLRIDQGRYAGISGSQESFRNINTREEYLSLIPIPDQG